jgi:hypothetical protein
MKYKKIIAIFCALFALLGCDKEEILTPAKFGPFNVNTDTGVATGQAFGIEFSMVGATGAEFKTRLSGAVKIPSWAEITLAEDLKIRLQTIIGSTAVDFDFNGKNYGKLESGDKVEIDKSRNLIVNGEKRSPAE